MDEKEGPVNLTTSKVVSDTFFVSAASIGVTILKPIRSILLGRILGPELYGILIIPVPYIQILTILSNIGFNTAVVKLMPQYRQQGRDDLAKMVFRSALFLTLALSLLWSALLFFLSGWIANTVSHRPDAVNPIKVYSLIIPFLSLNAFYAVAFLGMQRGRLKAALLVVYGSLNLLLPIFAVLWKENVTLVLAGFLAAEIMGSILYATFFHKRIFSGMARKAAGLMKGIRDVFGFGFLFFFASLGWNLINSVDRIMVKYYLPAEELGFYGMAALVITALSIISSTAGTALIPSLSAARASNDSALFRKQVANTTRLGLMVMVPVASLFFALSSDIFRLALPKFEASAGVLRILVFIGFIDIICRTSWASLVAYGSGGKAASAYIIAATVNVVLNRLLIPRYGIQGAAAATLMSFAVLAIVLNAMMMSVARVRLVIRDLLHPVSVALVFPALGLALSGLSSWYRLPLVAIPGMVIFIIIATLTGLVRLEDLEKSSLMLRQRPGTRLEGIAMPIISGLEKLARKK